MRDDRVAGTASRRSRGGRGKVATRVEGESCLQQRDRGASRPDSWDSLAKPAGYHEIVCDSDRDRQKQEERVVELSCVGDD